MVSWAERVQPFDGLQGRGKVNLALQDKPRDQSHQWPGRRRWRVSSTTTKAAERGGERRQTKDASDFALLCQSRARASTIVSNL